MFNKSKIFITGATGSWGQMLTTMLLDEYDVERIVCFSRGELPQVEMERHFNNPKLKFVIGDVRDYQAVEKAMSGADYVFHLAALKHVPVCERNVNETILTNIDGTTNVVNAAIANKVKKVIDVSSDKAVEPCNTYGMTKAIGEKIVISGNDVEDSDTQFVCIRGGNVMGSNGSAIPLFTRLIKNNETISLTDHRMTRYFLTLEEAIRLIFKASETSIGGETFVMRMPACKISDLIQVLMDRYGEVPVEETGIRPGEKIHETLISIHESLNAYKYDDTYHLILPPGNPNLHAHYSHLEPFGYTQYDSNKELMNLDEIKEMLEKGGFA